MKKKEFTINLDVAVFAKKKEGAIRNLGQHLANGNFRYWLGDINEEAKPTKIKCSKP